MSLSSELYKSLAKNGQRKAKIWHPKLRGKFISTWWFRIEIKGCDFALTVSLFFLAHFSISWQSVQPLVCLSVCKYKKRGQGRKIKAIIEMCTNRPFVALIQFVLSQPFREANAQNKMCRVYKTLRNHSYSRWGLNAGPFRSLLHIALLRWLIFPALLTGFLLSSFCREMLLRVFWLLIAYACFLLMKVLTLNGCKSKEQVSLSKLQSTTAAEIYFSQFLYLFLFFF